MKNKWRIIFLWVCLITSIPLSAEITEHQVNDITYVYDSEKNMIYNKNNIFPKAGAEGGYCLHIDSEGQKVLLKKFRGIFSKERTLEIGQIVMRAHVYIAPPGNEGEVDFLVWPEIRKKITFQELYALEKALKQFKDYVKFTSRCRKNTFYITSVPIPFDTLYENNTVLYQPLR